MLSDASDTEYDASSEEDESMGCEEGCDNDRCKYIEMYETELLATFAELKHRGNNVMGPAFLQLCDFATFANFCYNHTQPHI